MSTHAQCPHCACTDEGATIYQCDKCGTVFCSKCREIGFTEVMVFFPGATCPSCKGGGGSIGEIGGRDDDSDDDKETREDSERSSSDYSYSNSQHYSSSSSSVGSSGEFGLGTVLFIIPFGAAVAGFILWVVGALALSFLIYMADSQDHMHNNIVGCTSVVHRNDCWSILFRWSSYISFPAAIGGAIYSWYRVLSNRATWERIGVQFLWILGIIVALIVLNWIGSFLGHLR